MAEDAGMKYIVITSKHHDGFAMYHSAGEQVQRLRRHPFPSRSAEGTGRRLRPPPHQVRLLLFAGAGLARAQRRRQHLGFRSRRQEGFRPVPARQGRAAGEGTAHQLRPDLPDLVRYAAHDERRPRPALHRHRAHDAAGDADRRPPRRRGRLSFDGRQQDSRTRW